MRRFLSMAVAMVVVDPPSASIVFEPVLSFAIAPLNGRKSLTIV